MRIAVVGCGQIADAHIQEAQKIAGVEVVAVSDLNIHLAKQASIRFGVPGCYTDIDRMLSESLPDVVHVTTPPATHFFLAKKILSAGVHIYMEKPFTLNLPEAEEIVEFADRKGRLICAGHNSIFDPAYLRLMEIYEQSKIGRPLHLISQMGYNIDGVFGAVSMGDPTHWVHKLPGGLVQNNISHPISMLLGLMPGNQIKVSARGYRFRDKKYLDIRDNFFDEVRADMSSGTMTAHLIFSAHIRPVQTCITAFGTKATVFASMDSRTIRFTSGSSMPGPFAKLQWAYHDAAEAARELIGNIGLLARAKLHYFSGLNELLRRFYSAIEGKQPMPVPMTEALRVTAVMDDIIRECNVNNASEGVQ